MSIIAAPAVLALLGVLPSPRVDVGAFVGADVSGGYLPVDITVEPASPAIQVGATLRGGVRFVDDGYTLVLRGGPRVHAQAPNAFSVDRPLVYLSSDLGYQVTLSRRAMLTVAASAGAGELSYISLSSVFAPGTSAVDATVIPLVSAGGTVGFAFRNTERHTLRWGASIQHQQTFDAIAPEGADAVLPTTDSVALAMTTEHALSRVDQLNVRAAGLVFSAAEDPLSYVASTIATWSRRLSPRDQFTTAGGLDLLFTPDTGSVDPIPSATVGYGHQRELSSFDATLGVRAFFDRVALTYTPQAFCSVGAATKWSPDFSSSAAVSFSVNVLDRATDPEALGTWVVVNLPNSYALSRSFALTFGATASLAAPPLWVSDWSGSQAQATLYVGGAFTEGTGPGRGAFVR